MIVACATACLKCIEKVCDYINDSALAYMAVSGKGFCTCAFESFLLQIRHTAKFSFANLLAKIFIFLGKIGITVGNCLSLMFIMKNITMDTEEVGSVAGPVVIVAVFSFLTASVMLGMFDSVVLSMLTCLSIDLDLNDGQPAKGPKTFHDGVNKMDETKIRESQMYGNEIN